MKIFNPVREILFDYILIVAESTLSIAVIGSAFLGGHSICFAYFFLPFVLAAACLIPCIPVYVFEDMTVTQIMVQRAVELVVIVLCMVGTTRILTGGTISRAGYVAVAVISAVLDVVTYLVKWYFDKSEVDKINRKIQEYRRNRR